MQEVNTDVETASSILVTDIPMAGSCSYLVTQINSQIKQNRQQMATNQNDKFTVSKQF